MVLAPMQKRSDQPCARKAAAIGRLPLRACKRAHSSHSATPNRSAVACPNEETDVMPMIRRDLGRIDGEGLDRINDLQDFLDLGAA
jgi:hypothetical protein